MRFWLFALFLLPLFARAETLQLQSGDTVTYRLVHDPRESAQPVAEQLLRHLAAGRIEDAALLSNAPKRRYETLRDYMARVGEDEFKRVYMQYFFPENRVVAEIAVGPRRLIIWDLGEAGHQLAGQFYVDVDGKFLMDDVPSAERSQLRSILNAYRSGRAALPTSPARKD